MSAWGITDGSAGMVAQVKALATALHIEPEMKKILLRKPFVYLPNIAYASKLRFLIIPHVIDPASDALTPPYPDLIISCGRRAALVAMGLRHVILRERSESKDLKTLRQAQGDKVKFIHIQDPQVSSRYFDLVVAMEHDKIIGPNVIKSHFALHAITPDVLSAARQKFALRFTSYLKPNVAVLFGGSTHKYTFSKEAMAQSIAALQQVLAHMDGSLLITPSRRTGEENIAMLRNSFAGNACAYVYDFVEENPYLGMLALADTIIVTNDSVNMMSEACATGKPVYILKLPGHEGTKPARFAEMLIKDGIARRLGNTLESWSYPVSGEMGRIAEEVRKKL